MKTILLVDFSSTIREKLVSAIQNLNLLVIAASNGKEAVEIIQTTPPDLVITEIILSQMNGFELSRWINSHPEICNIPVIIYTSFDDEFTRYWSTRGTNVQEFIVKTEPLENLLQAIQKLIN